ncbi:MAG TPA: DNA gyrase subunit A [Clostridiales bacterium]|nr:DNA gyrase subunit A [Clostridiales bacterium]
MAKKVTSAELTEEFKKTLEMTKMLDVEVEEELKKSFIAYAMAVNVSRAIPDVRDGLKPVHRRILYSMHELGLYSDKAFRKCARIVGDCLGKYHPHGDSSVYDALVRLAQDFSINFPLIEGHGNFGSVDGDPAAAMRYTEARLSKLSSEMLRDLDKDTVDFYPTFDDTGMQPTVLPSRFPNMLVNGSDGIAVGMATNIPPHNLGEVIDGVVAMIENPDIDVDGLMQYIPAPDFPTGALIMGRSGIKRAYKTGRGSITIRSRCEVEEYKSGNTTRTRIIVTEIPYQVNKAKLIETMADLVKDKKIEGISDIREESDRDGMRIVIELKKESNPQVVLNTLYKHTNLQISDGLIMLALVDGTPKMLNLRDFIYYYLEHQKDIITRRTKFDLAKTEERAHILRGLVIAQASIEEVVEVCRSAVDKQDCVQKLTANFELDERQATAVAELRLYRLSHLEVDKLKEELNQLEAQIADYKDILAHESRVLDIIKTDLLEIKRKYPSERKTEISIDYDGEIEDADLIPVEQVVISMTHSGYVKRLPVTEYRAQNRGGMGITAHRPKDEDFVEAMFVCSSHDDILLFSDRGKVYRIKAYEIPEATRIARGRAIINIVQIAQDEKINTLMPVQEGLEGHIAFATRKGLIKKTNLTEFVRINKNGKIAIKLNDGDDLMSVVLTKGNDELIIASRSGKCIRFSEKDVRAMGRDTAGVKAMKLGKDDCLVDMLVVDHAKDVLTVTSNGFGKRSDIEDYRLQGRAGMGIKAGIFNEVTGWLVNLKQVTEKDDVMIISDGGTIIRMHCDEISRIGRNTKGVRLMRLKDGTVATVALTSRDEDEAAEELLEAAPELPPVAEDKESAGTGVEDFEEEAPADPTDDTEI